MTKNPVNYKIAEMFVEEQARLYRLIKKLSKIVLILIAITLLLSFIISFSKTMPFFYTVTEKSVTVRPGDTLWNIAEENMGDYPYGIASYIAEIRKLNDMGGSSNIISGSEVILPIYKYRLS